MHTGTHFCRHGLFSEFARANAGEDSPDENVIVNVHVMPHDVERLHKELARGEAIIVVPLRHPARVYHSFLNRGKTKEMFIEQWDNMMNIIAPHKPFYIHLDLPERRQEVDVIEQAIGMKLPVSDSEEEWKVFNSRASSYNMSLDEFPTDEIPSKYIDFYESTRLLNI